MMTAKQRADMKRKIREEAKKLPPTPTKATPEQCGVRLYERKRGPFKFLMLCTLPRGHEKDVHECHAEGVFLGGWVDRVSEPEDDWQQFPRART